MSQYLATTLLKSVRDPYLRATRVSTCFSFRRGLLTPLFRTGTLVDAPELYEGAEYELADEGLSSDEEMRGPEDMIREGKFNDYSC